MVQPAGTASISTTLTHWLRLLWDMAPALQLNSDQAYIAAGTIHLPARSCWQLHAPAAAHAAAHLVYSPAIFDGEGLGAIARSLMGLLEDARVEALAIRELPGLARLWRPLHTSTPDLGAGFESLMQRLARSLADPDYDDPDPWVRKGRALFYADAQRLVPALRTPADVRRVATRLGHDIGQMRLQFNAKTYIPLPDYRDDHRWMWPADVLNTVPPPAAGSSRDSDEAATITWHPEWDRLISRMRAEWCRVVEQQAPRTAMQAAIDDPVRRTANNLRRPLRVLTHCPAAPDRSDEGELFDPGALVDWHIARRVRKASEARVYRVLDRRMGRAAVCLLIDQSASTAAAHGAGGRSVLQTAIASASALALALQSAGVDCAIAGFSSYGRQAVRIVTIKSFDEAADNCMFARLQALRAGGSTRLGTALRYVTCRLVERSNAPLWVIVLSDGEPHDVDVHDPRYLIDDARQAVLAAGRRDVRIACLDLAPARSATVGKIFSRTGVQAVQTLRDLPRALSHLLS